MIFLQAYSFVIVGRCYILEPRYIGLSTQTDSSHNVSMSIIKAEPVDPYLVGAIATGRPKLEIVVDDETVVKTDPDSVDYNGPFVKDVASVKEECLNDDAVCFFVCSFSRVCHNIHTQEVPTTSRKRRRAEGASGEVSTADLSHV